MAYDAKRSAALAHVYQQSQRWIAAGVFEYMVHGLRALLFLTKGKKEQPSATIFK